MSRKHVRLYMTSMASYWLVFGLITTFSPVLMDLVQTDAGVAAGTAFSDHTWMHGGFDIIALCVLLFALACEVPNRTMVRAAAIAALMPTAAIAYSLLVTAYWNPLFIVAGLGCLSFAVWGFVLAHSNAGYAAEPPVAVAQG